MSTLLIKADWAFGEAETAKHFLKHFLPQFHFEKIYLKDEVATRIETNLSLVGQLYFHSMLLRDNEKCKKPK